jgi:Large ribosomal RNA subunit accumulation protein YceD
MTPEFSHLVALDMIGAGGHDVAVEAREEQRRRLAGRFGWIAIDSLVASVHLVARAGGIDASGRLSAMLDQKCVATGDPVRETVNTDFTVRFVDVALLGAGEDIELADGDLDIIEFTGGSVDVGEAIAQTLALSVDPFPRSADADAKLRAAGVVSEGETGGAFAGLKGLLRS